ncbi:hypothetical protein QBC39DRAFT_102444 [Podospora conica]|nr:hypothetical protein QBC39DRAFT_102444 [Schizothecium conicum]
MLRGEAGVRCGLDASRVPGILAGCLESGLWWCGGGCRSGRILLRLGFPACCIWMPAWPSRVGPQANRSIPIHWKICRRQAWHRGERWVDGVAFLPGLACCLLSDRQKHQTGRTLPRRGPMVNGGTDNTLEQSLGQDLWSKPMSACLSACGLSMCTGAAGGIHGGRMSPMAFSRDGILLRCIRPNIASLVPCMSYRAGWRRKPPRPALPPSKRKKRGAWQRRCRSGGPPPACFVSAPAVSLFPPAASPPVCD